MLQQRHSVHQDAPEVPRGAGMGWRDYLRELAALKPHAVVIAGSRSGQAGPSTAS
jgi:hypothetical protein